jgi:hypothetical protein
MSEENTQQQQQQQTQQQQLNLDDIDVNSQDVALNLMAQFLELAQKRGAFTLQESAKIYQSVKFFRPVKKEEDEVLENKKD